MSIIVRYLIRIAYLLSHVLNLLIIDHIIWRWQLYLDTRSPVLTFFARWLIFMHHKWPMRECIPNDGRCSWYFAMIYFAESCQLMTMDSARFYKYPMPSLRNRVTHNNVRMCVVCFVCVYTVLCVFICLAVAYVLSSPWTQVSKLAEYCTNFTTRRLLLFQPAGMKYCGISFGEPIKCNEIS